VCTGRTCQRRRIRLPQASRLTPPLISPLCILLPVHNAQATLAADVARLLDALPELAAWFDLLIIDDGSTDATCEIAEELVTEFPQVRLIRHAVRRGVEGSWRAGLERTDAPIVVAHDGRPAVEPIGIFSLLRQQPSSQSNSLTAAQPAARGQGTIVTDSRLLQWLSAQARSDEALAAGGFCVLRREAELPATRQVHGWRIEPGHAVRTAAPAATPKPIATPQPVPAPKASTSRPSFLRRLQNLALGE